jgi:hypothetical protein
MLANDSDVLMSLELELVDDRDWDAPSDTSYVDDRDRNNPEITVNVEAITATSQLIARRDRDLCSSER